MPCYLHDINLLIKAFCIKSRMIGQGMIFINPQEIPCKNLSIKKVHQKISYLKWFHTLPITSLPEYPLGLHNAIYKLSNFSPVYAFSIRTPLQSGVNDRRKQSLFTLSFPMNSQPHVQAARSRQSCWTKSQRQEITLRRY